MVRAGRPAHIAARPADIFTAPPERFRAELDVDSWRRGRGRTLAQAVVAMPYYWDTDPGMIRQASRALAETLAESP